MAKVESGTGVVLEEGTPELANGNVESSSSAQKDVEEKVDELTIEESTGIPLMFRKYLIFYFDLNYFSNEQV